MRDFMEDEVNGEQIIFIYIFLRNHTIKNVIFYLWWMNHAKYGQAIKINHRILNLERGNEIYLSFPWGSVRDSSTFMPWVIL